MTDDEEDVECQSFIRAICHTLDICQISRSVFIDRVKQVLGSNAGEHQSERSRSGHTLLHRAHVALDRVRNSVFCYPLLLQKLRMAQREERVAPKHCPWRLSS
jgi:hypothetical protein